MREFIIFQCTECGNRPYSSTKNKKKKPEKIELKKFCKHCRKYTILKEVK